MTWSVIWRLAVAPTSTPTPTPTLTPIPVSQGTSGNSATSPWHLILVACIALLGVLTTAGIQWWVGRRTTRELKKTADAATVNAQAAKMNAEAAQRSTEVAERNAALAERAHEEARQSKVTAALVDVTGKLLTPPSFPRDYEFARELVTYMKGVGSWMDSTSVAMSSAWSSDRDDHYMVIVNARHSLKYHVDEIQRIVTSIFSTLGASASSGMLIAELRHSADSEVHDLFSEVWNQSHHLERKAAETMRQIRDCLRSDGPQT